MSFLKAVKNRITAQGDEDFEVLIPVDSPKYLEAKAKIKFSYVFDFDRNGGAELRVHVPDQKITVEYTKYADPQNDEDEDYDEGEETAELKNVRVKIDQGNDDEGNSYFKVHPTELEIDKKGAATLTMKVFF